MNRRDVLAGGLAASLLVSGRAIAGLPPYVYDPQNPGDPYVVRTGVAAARVRAVGARAQRELTGGGLLGPGVAAGMALPGLDADDQELVWGQFFLTAQILFGHVENETPVVGYYNPLLDVWWLTRWDAKGTERRILSAKTLVGGGLNLAPSMDPRPGWRRRLDMKTVIESLRAAGPAEGRAFSRAFAFDAAGPPTLFDRLGDAGQSRLFLQRNLLAVKGVADFAADTPAFNAYSSVLKALSANAPNRPAALAADAGPLFDRTGAFPLIFRRDHTPVAITRSADTWIVASSNLASGRFILLCAVSRAGQVLRVTMLDLMGG